MNFSDEEIRALATFLGRRLTPDLRPTDPTDAPVYGHSPYDQWERALRKARSNGRVPRLFRAAARAMPDDPALAEASALVDANSPSERMWAGSALVLASAAVMLVAFGGVVTTAAMLAFGGIGASHARAVASAEATPHEAASPVQRFAPLVEALATSVSAPAPRVEDGPPEGSLEERRVVAQAGPCKDDGWFYAGTERPPERYIAPHALNVRAEPPSKDNGWNSRAPIRCYLGKGDIVRLENAPLELPGHHYWVHLTPEDVTRPLDVAMR